MAEPMSRTAAVAPEVPGTAEPLLEVRGLGKSFGALHVTVDVSFDVLPGEVHALIGPNGAGKTTLINQLFGELRPDRGTVRFDGRDITALPPDARARRGLARSFQITSVLGSLSVRENLALALAGRDGRTPSPWRPLPDRPDIAAEVARLLRQVGLDGQAEAAARNLAYGQQRALEIAMGLALQPRLLLLDEPMAGTGPEESQRMVSLLRGLKRSVAILLVEHDMDAVFALADRLTVLAEGRVIAAGTPAEIQRNPDVRAAYLGDEAVPA
ncbi:ABC transporter ATP-binding protein [Roseomonas sp. BN140053]|uniref:ABC transporter ATP-binding protein n=1 Tax=Roseomonas sp. BN140053 TaxID=3391898 RepID=UPI0039EB267A